MNNIEEKVKIIAEVLNVHTDPLMDNLKHSTDATVEEICKCMDAYQPPQPSDEEIERMAQQARPGQMPVTTKTYDTFTVQLDLMRQKDWSDGFKSGLSYRSKEEWVSCKDRLPQSNKLVLAFDGKVFHLALYTKGHELNVDIDDDEYQSDEYEKLKGECYLKPGWYSQEEQSQSSYDFIYMNRDIIQWQELPPTDLLTTKQKPDAN